MNIREAKEQIRRSVTIYLMKNEKGEYRIPVQKQRPIFLYGAPGIGKTAIMEQIAEELSISLVTYSMTHHTRQSAIGLPFITKKEYGGEEYDISRYTMSEIIASVYDKIEETGRKEGILFLDEINCVSETLGPSMLQFLQYKVFGNKRVPDGWVVVTAGNPPEFNRSVREFDVVTLDRMKIMEVEPDYEAWRRYALERGLHKSILSFLEIRHENFYSIETTVDGKSYVTARGWEDLSEIIYLYEECGFPVDEALIVQYIRNRQISGEFAAYYALFAKYREDYRVREILRGTEPSEIRARASEASFDERITILGLLLECLMPRLRANVEKEDSLKARVSVLRAEKAALACRTDEKAQADFERRKAEFEADVARMKKEGADLSAALDNAFGFVEECFGEGNEMLILLTELSINRYSARFIAGHGCEAYFKHDRHYMLYDRNKELENEIRAAEKQEKDELQI